jgi:hypothetical protein
MAGKSRGTITPATLVSAVPEPTLRPGFSYPTSLATCLPHFSIAERFSAMKSCL